MSGVVHSCLTPVAQSSTRYSEVFVRTIRIVLMGLLALPLAAAAQDGDAGSVAPAEAVAKMEKLKAQVDAYADAMGDDASSDDWNCIAGNKALISELLTTAKKANQNLAAAESAGDEAAAAREARAVRQAFSAAEDLANAAAVCAQSAGVAGADARLSVEGGTGDADEDTEKPDVDSLLVGMDPPDVSPF